MDLIRLGLALRVLNIDTRITQPRGLVGAMRRLLRIASFKVVIADFFPQRNSTIYGTT